MHKTRGRVGVGVATLAKLDHYLLLIWIFVTTWRLASRYYATRPFITHRAVVLASHIHWTDRREPHGLSAWQVSCCAVVRGLARGLSGSQCLPGKPVEGASLANRTLFLGRLKRNWPSWLFTFTSNCAICGSFSLQSFRDLSNDYQRTCPFEKSRCGSSATCLSLLSGSCIGGCW